MELDALVQLERVDEPIRRDGPALGEIADDLAVLAAVVLHKIGVHRADGVQQRERLRRVAVVVGRLGHHREVQNAATLGRLGCGRAGGERQGCRDAYQRETGSHVLSSLDGC